MLYFYFPHAIKAAIVGRIIYFAANYFFIFHHRLSHFSESQWRTLKIGAFTHSPTPQRYLNARHYWSCHKMYIIKKYLVTDF